MKHLRHKLRPFMLINVPDNFMNLFLNNSNKKN